MELVILNEYICPWNHNEFGRKYGKGSNDIEKFLIKILVCSSNQECIGSAYVTTKEKQEKKNNVH